MNGRMRFGIVGEVRGRGLMIGVEIVKDQATREVAGAWRDAIVELAFKRGLLILGCGETSFRLSPPLVVNKYEAMIALDILEECIEAVGRSQDRSPSMAALGKLVRKRSRLRPVLSLSGTGLERSEA